VVELAEPQGKVCFAEQVVFGPDIAMLGLAGGPQLIVIGRFGDGVEGPGEPVGAGAIADCLAAPAAS
jgi:hypothetical protein